jgi:3-dehydroquinate dehydratase II
MSTSCVIHLINGPNLNLLGEREPEKYGSLTLAELENDLKTKATEYGLTLKCFQSNHEGALIDEIHRIRKDSAGLIINPAAYSHTSIALRDALAVYPAPIYEVHITNIHQREPYRHHSYVSELATDVICGFGVKGYEMALQSLVKNIIK